MRVIKQLVIVHSTHHNLVAKCMVLVIQHHCGQTFSLSIHLGGIEEHSPVRRGGGAQPRAVFWTILVNFWKQILGL